MGQLMGSNLALLSCPTMSILRRIEKTTPRDLPAGWKLQGSHARTRYVSEEVSKRGRSNLFMSICHLFNPPDVCPQM